MTVRTPVDGAYHFTATTTPATNPIQGGNGQTAYCACVASTGSTDLYITPVARGDA